MNRFLIVVSIPLVLIATTACAKTPAPEISSPSSPVTVNSPQPPRYQILQSGVFRDGEHPTQGKVRIVLEEKRKSIELGPDFRTDQGPDLFVILHRSNDVIGTTPTPSHSIQEGDYVAIAPLRSTSGEQRYTIPDDINLANYHSVAIWCRQFNATFGAATLQVQG